MPTPILIDSQVIFWSIEDNSRLGARAQAVLRDGTQSICASYFSLLELAFKAGSGKLQFMIGNAVTYLKAMDIDIVPPGSAELRSYQIFNPKNKDPFDNLLITIAIQNNFILMTADTDILATKARGLRLLDATK